MTSFSSSGIPNSFRNLALASLNLSVSSSSLMSWFLLYSAMMPCGSMDKDGRVAVWSTQNNSSRTFVFFFFHYLNFSFDEGGDVVLVLKDGEGLQQVVLQPLPVLRDLLARASWRGESGRSQSVATQKGIHDNKHE